MNEELSENDKRWLKEENCEEDAHVIILTKEYAEIIRDCGGITVECERCGAWIYIENRTNKVSIPDAETKDIGGRR